VRKRDAVRCVWATG
jgi:hypothetical protein